jgi:hypothetical protein
MLAFDIIGLIFTVLLVGPRYGLYVLSAVVIGEIGQILMTLYMNAQIDAVVTGGIFGGATFHGIQGGVPVLLIYFSGAIFNYFVGTAFGGIELEKFNNIVNPFANVKKPFAVVNIRLAIWSGLYSGWQYFFR